jgi:hypothetical protein
MVAGLRNELTREWETTLMRPRHTHDICTYAKKVVPHIKRVDILSTGGTMGNAVPKAR